MLSLRQALTKLDVLGEFSLRAHLRSWPPSLAELMRIANLPPPDLRDLNWRKIHSYTANDAQGVSHGRGSTWFLSSVTQIKSFQITGADPTHPEAIVEIQSIELENLIEQTDLAGVDLSVDHIGALAFGHDLVFIPVSRASSPHRFLLATDENFNVVGYNRLSPETGDAWCALNDWNGLLYMPHAEDDGRWLAFDLSGFVERLSEPTAWGSPVTMEPRSERDFRLLRSDGGAAALQGSQGIAFSPTGTVYATRTDFGSLPGGAPFTNFVEVFSSLTGKRFSDGLTGTGIPSDPGVAGIRRINFGGFGDEVEGAGFHPSGVMYVTVAEHDLFGEDDYELYAFSSEGDRPL